MRAAALISGRAAQKISCERHYLFRQLHSPLSISLGRRGGSTIAARGYVSVPARVFHRNSLERFGVSGGALFFRDAGARRPGIIPLSRLRPRPTAALPLEGRAEPMARAAHVR